MKKWILPVIAGVVVIIALIVVFLIPGKNKEPEAEPGQYANRDRNGNIVIRAEDLSHDQVSFIRIAADSKIELLARIGDDGKVKAALGTCQSCNGSPFAYYTQEEDELVCNNCGLHFPLNVLDEPGSGCHPISIQPAIITETAEGIMLDGTALMQYENLFAKIETH